MTKIKIFKKRFCGECPECKSNPKLSCFWQIEEKVPEKFKPSEINAFISVENINGIGYLKASEISGSFDSEFLSWFVSFCLGKKINAFWKTKNVPFYIGSPEFLETIWRALKEGSL